MSTQQRVALLTITFLATFGLTMSVARLLGVCDCP